MTVNLQQLRLFLTVLLRQDLNCSDFLPNYSNTRTICFFGANEVTSLWAYNLSRCFVIYQSVKLIG